MLQAGECPCKRGLVAEARKQGYLSERFATFDEKPLRVLNSELNKTLMDGGVEARAKAPREMTLRKRASPGKFPNRNIPFKVSPQDFFRSESLPGLEAALR